MENDLRARVEAVKEREARAQRKAEDALQQRLRDARREIDRVVEDARAKAGALADAAANPRLVTRGGGISRSGGRVTARVSGGLSTGETGHLRADARAALDAVAGSVHAGRPDDAGTLLPPEPEALPLEVGVRVRVPMGLEGVVTSVQGKTAEVSVNGKRLKAAVADLVVLGRPGAAPAAGRVSVSMASSEASSSDLNVIGCTVPEAIERTDKFLDQAVLGELREVRVIHGHGTGQLRRALAEFLAEHPQVVRAAGAPPNQGGGGVTVVELKD
jgi:DNA mismatch repair protein MutS2